MSTSTLSGTRLRVPRYGSSLPHSDYDDSVTSLPSGSLHLTSDADETDPETAPNRTQPRVAVSDDESPASKLRRAIARANNLSYQPSRSATSTTRMDAPSVHDSDIDDPSEPDHDVPESEALSEARSQLKAVFAKALGPPRDDELKPRRLAAAGHDGSLFRRSANQLEPLESLCTCLKISSTLSSCNQTIASRTREEHTQDSYKSILEDIESIDNSTRTSFYCLLPPISSMPPESDSSSTTPSKPSLCFTNALLKDNQLWTLPWPPSVPLISGKPVPRLVLLNLVSTTHKSPSLHLKRSDRERFTHLPCCVRRAR